MTPRPYYRNLSHYRAYTCLLSLSARERASRDSPSSHSLKMLAVFPLEEVTEPYKARTHLL